MAAHDENCFALRLYHTLLAGKKLYDILGRIQQKMLNAANTKGIFATVSTVVSSLGMLFVFAQKMASVAVYIATVYQNALMVFS